MIQQQLDNFTVPVPRRIVKRGRAQPVAGVGVGAGIEERFHTGGVIGLDRFVKVIRSGRPKQQRGQSDARDHGRAASGKPTYCTSSSSVIPNFATTRVFKSSISARRSAAVPA